MSRKKLKKLPSVSPCLKAGVLDGINKIILFWKKFFDIEEKIIIQFQPIVEKENAVGLYEDNPDVDFINIIIDPSVDCEKTFLHELVENNPDLIVSIPASLPEEYILKLEQAREDYMDTVAEILISFRKR